VEVVSFSGTIKIIAEDGRGGILVSKMGTNLCRFYFLTLKLLG
jgi:hypothetical protein